MLTPEQRNRFQEKGWLVVNGVFDRDEAERIAQLALRVGEEELKLSSSVYLADHSPNGAVAPRKIDYPYRKSQEFKEFVTNGRLVNLVSKLMGAPGLLCSDAIFLKPPHFGSAKPYHQDNAYFLCTPADHVVTAWIALDDVDESNGCLRYIDGSHLAGIIPHEPVPDEPHNMAPSPQLIDLSRESLAIVDKGGVVFHHGNTLHTSHRNESDRWRRGYASNWVASDVIGESDFLDQAYFKDQA